jgi:hypothetical protein
MRSSVRERKLRCNFIDSVPAASVPVAAPPAAAASAATVPAAPVTQVKLYLYNTPPIHWDL